MNVRGCCNPGLLFDSIALRTCVGQASPRGTKVRFRLRRSAPVDGRLLLGTALVVEHSVKGFREAVSRPISES